MWKRIKLTKPDTKRAVLVAYYDEYTKSITRVATGSYELPLGFYPFWPNIWMEIPTEFHPDQFINGS